MTSIWERAAIDGDYAIIKSYVYIGKKGYTDNVLKLAVKNGHMKILRFLWKFSGNDCINIQFKSKMNLPFLASENGHLDILKFLMLYYPDFSYKNTVEIASANGYFEIVKFLSKKVDWSVNAVIFAAKNGHKEIVDFLLKSYDNNVSDNIINFAAMNGHLDTIKLMYDTYDIKGCSTAIDYASYNGYLEPIKYLHKKGIKGTELAVNNAMENNNIEIVKYLIEYGYDISSETLESAARSGNIEILEYLLKKGISSSFAMTEAILNNQVDALKYLYIYNQENKIQGFEILEAITFGYYDIVKFLTENCQVDILRILKYCIETVYDCQDFKMFKLFIKFLVDNNLPKNFEEEFFKNTKIYKIIKQFRIMKDIKINDQCPICMDAAKTRKKIITKCQHIFHKKCIKKWLEKEENCPLCRKELIHFL